MRHLDHDSSTAEPIEVIVDDLPDDQGKRPSGAHAWAISVGVHALFALLMWAVVMAAKQVDTELPPMRIADLTPPPKPEVKKPVERSVEKTFQVNIPESDVVAPISPIEPTPDVTLTTDNEVDANSAQGLPDNVAVSQDGATGAFLAIGAAGGSAGPLGNRGPGAKRRAVVIGGGTPTSESGVDAALRWFKRHQSPNGMWDVERYAGNCAEAPKCEPGSLAQAGGSDANVAMTGYALLCYLGAGYDHRVGKYRATVQRGLDYLRSVQKNDGLLGERNYEHAIASMALAEAYAMTIDPDLKAPAQKAVNVILARESKDAKASGSNGSGLGWDYRDPNPTRNDASVTGWNVMALKSALAGGLEIGSGMGGARQWLERAWKASNPDWQKLTDPYSSTSTFAYTWDATTDKVDIGAPGSDAHDMAPVGALCAVFLGHHRGDLMLETLCNHAIKYQFPTSYPCNTYYLYYNTMAMFQAGGDRWKKWNNTVRDMLVGAQRKGDGCFDGSWDWNGTKFHGSDTGRVLSTAYCCLCLEVYYREKQVGGDERK